MNKSIYIIIAKGASEPGCEQGEPRVPKKEISIDRINPINPRGELDARFCSGRKLSISRSILVRLRPRLAGSAAVCVFYGLVFYIYIFSQIILYILFYSANKIMYIQGKINILINFEW